MNKKFIMIIILVSLGVCIIPNSCGTIKDIHIVVKEDEASEVNNEVHMYREHLNFMEDVDWWSMFHHDPQLTGYTTSMSPITNHLLWTYSTGVYFGGFCSPAVVDDRLYMGTSSFFYLYKDAMEFQDYIYGNKYPFRYKGHLVLKDFDNIVKLKGEDVGILYCLNAYNGAELWSFYTVGYEVSSPTVYENRVYISSVSDYDPVGKIYCLDVETGDEIWFSPLFSPFTSPNVADDKLYVSAIDVNGEDYIGKIFCLDIVDGSEIWNYTIGIGEYLFLSTPAIAYGNIYFATYNENEGVPGHIYCLDAETGDKIWQSSIWSMLTSPVIGYGKVYISSYDPINDRGILLCLDVEDGGEQWRYMMGVEELAAYSTPAVAYGNVYFSTLDAVSFRAKVICINASTGGYIWSRTPGDMMMLSSPAVADKKVYIASYLYSNLYCFDYTNGTIIWSYPLEFGTLTSPAIANYTLYTVDASGIIYAFQDVNKRPAPPDISGSVHGKVGRRYSYTFVSEDADGDDVYYYIDWGDDNIEEWFGPYKSGEEVIMSHRWFKQGDFIIRCKAKDINDLESDWGTLEVTMPKNRAIYPSFLSFLMNHTYMFPILNKIIQRLGLQ